MRLAASSVPLRVLAEGPNSENSSGVSPRSSWWSPAWWQQRPAAAGPASPAARESPPPASRPAAREPRPPRRRTTYPITLLEWHDSPLPVKVTAAKAALQPSIAVRKDWGGSDGEGPAQLAWTLRADLQLPATLKLDLSCKEAVLGGQLSASLPGGRLEYRKRFKLPNGALLALGAGLQVTGGSGGSSGGAGRRRQRRRWLKPFLTCQLQMDSSSSGGGSDEVVVSESGFSDTHRLNLPTRWGSREVPPMELEVASTLCLPSSLSGLAGGLSALTSSASLQSLAAGGLSASPSLSNLATSLPSSPSMPSVGLPALPTQFPAAVPGLPSFASVPTHAAPGTPPGLPSLPRTPSLPGLPQLPRPPSLPGLPSLARGASGGGGDGRALEFSLDRVALVLRL